MPVQPAKEVIVFVLNLGTGNLAFLDKAKDAVCRRIEEKIFLRPKDEVGLVLMGSNITKNNYNVDNVEVHDITMPTWDRIRTIMNIECTAKTVSWVNAVYVAVSYINEQCIGAGKKEVVLLSDAQGITSTEELLDRHKLVSLAQRKMTSFLYIGDEKRESGSKEPDSSSLPELVDFCRVLDGRYMSVDCALNDVRIFRRVSPNVVPWKCDMDVYGITIPIAAYVKITRERKLPSWKLKMQGQTEPAAKVERRVELLDKHRVERRAEDSVSGYIYGDKSIPFSDEDESAMIHRSGPKSYRVHRFVAKHEVGIDSWHGQGTRLILPGSNGAAETFYTLMQVMLEKGLLAIVRKVHNNNATPKMVVLYPRAVVSKEPRCFVEIELPFSEDRNAIESRPMKSALSRLSKEQGEAIDNLLTAIALKTDAADKDDGTESTQFLPGCVPNPAVQHCWDALAARAIAPDDPLPPMDDFLIKLVRRPEHLKTRSGSHLIRVMETFDLKIREKSSVTKRQHPSKP